MRRDRRPPAGRDDRHPARRPGRLRGAGRHAGRHRGRRPGPHHRPLGGPGHPAEPRVQPHHARRPPGADAGVAGDLGVEPGRAARRPGRGGRDQHARLDPLCPRVHPAPGQPRPGRRHRRPATAGPLRLQPAVDRGPADQGPPDLRLPGPAARSAGRGGPDGHARLRPRRPLDDLLRDPGGPPVPGRGSGDPGGRGDRDPAAAGPRRRAVPRIGAWIACPATTRSTARSRWT